MCAPVVELLGVIQRLKLGLGSCMKSCTGSSLGSVDLGHHMSGAVLANVSSTPNNRPSTSGGGPRNKGLHVLQISNWGGAWLGVELILKIGYYLERYFLEMARNNNHL